VFFVAGSVLKYSASILPKKLLKGLGISKRGIQVFHTFKCANDLVQLAKEETAVQGMNDRLIEIGRWYGVEKNVEKY
jgi:hypothetical protein